MSYFFGFLIVCAVLACIGAYAKDPSPYRRPTWEERLDKKWKEHVKIHGIGPIKIKRAGSSLKPRS